MNAKHLTIIVCLIVIHCQTVKSFDRPEADRKGKSIVVASTSAQDDQQNEIKEMLETVEQKREDIWNIIEVKEDGDPKGYTTTDHVLRALPEQTDEIINWLKDNPGSDEDDFLIIKKGRFIALLQSLEPRPKKHKKPKKDLGLCTTNTQDFSYFHKMVEIKKIWKIVELKDIVESEEKRRGSTSITEIIKVLPKYTDEILKWMETDGGQFQLTENNFTDLMQWLPLDLEALKALNKHLEENPLTFLD